MRFRFPKVFQQWEENPLSVNAPQGESLAAATERFRAGLAKILRRYRGQTIALVLRPMSMQVCAGLLRGEDLQTIASLLYRFRNVTRRTR